MKEPAVYILASKRNGTLYTGVTSNLVQRIWQHREGIGSGFTRKFGCKRLVWFERFDEMLLAIEKEKRIKGGSRASKLALIAAGNPQWLDLFDMIARAGANGVALSPPIPRNDD